MVSEDAIKRVYDVIGTESRRLDEVESESGLDFIEFHAALYVLKYRQLVNIYLTTFDTMICRTRTV